MMVAFDVVALYPSLETGESAKICGQQVEKSTLEIENHDYQEMLTYIRLNQDKVENLGELQNFLPVRAFKFGRQPGMRNQMKGPPNQKDLKEGESKWIHVAPQSARDSEERFWGKWWR